MAEARKPRRAVVLFNLGGPDQPAAIRPFLINLFCDPAILRVPFFIRPFLARFIATRRVKPATENYAYLGGKSPLLDLTRDQVTGLQTVLSERDPQIEIHCFVAMRYWHPFASACVQDVLAWRPDQIVLLPLYPQYSTTTTGSSLSDWRRAAAKAGLACDVTTLCCWHSDPDYITATAALIRHAYESAMTRIAPGVALRLLFSAHGLPERIVTAGDPYQFQIERTVAALMRALAIPGLDHRICYQSRATPQKWLDPSTEHEIAQAGREGVALLVMPVAFISDHSETLVELDIEYGELATRSGVPGYFRVPAQNSDPAFIDALAGLVERSAARGPGLCSFAGGRICPAPHRDCPHARAGNQVLPDAA